MSSDDLTMSDLTAEEQQIIQRLRQENEEKQKTVVASESSFKSWLQANLPNIWQKILQIGETIVIQIVISAVKHGLGLPF
jgi:uncharacterized membrane protein YraQ (UPF0718 family)